MTSGKKIAKILAEITEITFQKSRNEEMKLEVGS